MKTKLLAPLSRQTRLDRLVTALLLTLLISMGAAVLGDFSADCNAVRTETLRLHILAHSDAPEEQAVKLAVRDAVLEEFSGALATLSPADAAAKLQALRPALTQTAVRVLAEEGFSHPVRVKVLRDDFSTRKYAPGEILPAGEYLAVRIEIGDAKGKNWWCVMYPPLCLPVATTEQQASLTEAIHALSETPNYEVKFALVEGFERLCALAG